MKISVAFCDKTVIKRDDPSVTLKVAFFQKVLCIFLIAQKMCRKLSWKRHFEIVFCLESADSNCTAVSKGGKIQKHKA